MNFRQLQYAILLSEIGSFSLVAERLNITQPALSKQILSLEKEIGTSLFNRNNSSTTLTAAGEYFIRYAKDIIYNEKQLLRSMEQFKNGNFGNLVIGMSSFRSSYLLPPVIKKVRDKYPGIRVKLHEASVETLKKEATDGNFDFAMVNLPVDESLFDVTPIESDNLVLVVHNDIVENTPLKEKTEITFAETKDLPFVVIGPNQETRKLFENLCVTANITPNIVAEVVTLTTSWEMACQGVGATLLPLQFIKNKAFNQNLKIIKIKDSTLLRQPVIITIKGQYISECARYTIDLLTNK